MRKVLVFLCISVNILLGQGFDDFSDGNLAIGEIIWGGSLENFIINDAEHLQLSAESGSSSIIYSQIIANDNMSWAFDVQLDFSPSSSNQLRIWLISNSFDFSAGDGILLEIGESGSNDAIKVIRFANGSSTTIAEGIMGNVGVDPVIVSLKIQYTNSQNWVIQSSYNSTNVFENEIEFSENVSLEGTIYSALECRYTSSRRDKFSFDNITLPVQANDTEAPLITDFQILSANKLSITFNEPILDFSNSAEFSPMAQIKSIVVDPNVPHQYCISLNENLERGINYVLSLTNFSDLRGNSASANIDVVIPALPEPGDLLINELLYDPFPGGTDFLELFNNSNNSIQLSNLIVSNEDNGRSVQLTTPFILEPDSFIVLTVNPADIIDRYRVRNEARILRSSLPAFSNGSGNVTLRFETSEVSFLMDEFDYDDDLHTEIIDDPEGISLERKSIENNADDVIWTSAASLSGYATPGYQNSAFTESNNDQGPLLSILNPTFSPNNDGDGDELTVEFGQKAAGLVLNAQIYDRNGRFVAHLAQNELLGTGSFVKWNGEDDEGNRAAIGVYVLYTQFFNLDGEVFARRNAIVLADFIN